MVSSISVLWSVIPNLKLLSVTWDDETVVYNCSSGDTHLLNRIATEALICLQNHPCTRKELADMLISPSILSENQELDEEIETLLLNFQELGLIQPVNET